MKLILLQMGQGDFLEPLIQLLNQFAGFLDNFLGALAIFFIGWILARLLSRGLRKLLEKIGLDKLADRLNTIELFSKANFSFEPSLIFSKIVYYLIMFVAFMAATDVLGMPSISNMVYQVFEYLPRLISALFVFLLGVFLADAIKNLVQTASRSLNLPAGKLIANFVFYFLFINVAMITLSQAGVQTEFIQDNLSIILGGIVFAFAIGYGLASRPIVANLLSAYYNREKVKVGDRIRVEDTVGEVIAIDNTSITIQAEGGARRVIVPISKLSSEIYEILTD